MGYYGAIPSNQKISRLEALQPSGDNEAPAEVIFPEIDSGYDYLRGLWFDIRQAKSTGQGLIPLDWTDIRNWRLENHLNLTIWEKETIIKMSEAYCAEYSRATDPQRQPPYQIIKEDDEIDEEAEIRKALSWRSMIRSKGKPNQ